MSISILDFGRIKNIPAPYNAWERKQPYVSKYGSGMSTIIGSVAKMLLTAFQLKEGTIRGGLGVVSTPSGDQYVAEYKSSVDDEFHVIVYSPAKGTCLAAVYDVETGSMEQYKCSKGGRDGTAILLAMLPVFMEEDEFKENFDKLYSEFVAGFPDEEAAKEPMWILCDNVYRRTLDTALTSYVKYVEPSSGLVTRITKQAIKQGTYEPKSVIMGGFEILSTKSSNAGSVKRVSDIDHKDFVGKYPLSKRVLTLKEKALVPELENFIVIAKEAVTICKLAHGSTGKATPHRNFLLRGGAGSGKTFTAKQIASGLNLPLTTLTCHPDMSMDELIGQLLPKTQEMCTGEAEVLNDMGGITAENVAQMLNLPDMDTIEFDPVEAYKMLSGTENPQANPQDCFVLYVQTLMDKMYELNSQTDDGEMKYTFVEGALLEAIKNGWVCEIQEPTVISRPGVLVGLNGILEQKGTIRLPDGRVIRRHPDAVVVVTTNVDYEGCRGLNQSLISRMNGIWDVQTPGLPVMVERAMKVTEETDESLVRMMAEVVCDIAGYCKENNITEGVTGMRELLDWITANQILGNPYETAQHTIIAKATSDEDEQIAICSACLEKFFSPSGDAVI